MNMLDLTIVVVFIITLAALLSRRVRNSQNWSAVVTPLASIIGSGFLVSAPLLAGAVGIWAILAVIVLTLLAYLIGGAIRYNIRFGEPVFLGTSSSNITKRFETLSHLVLIGAYFISVAYYLVLLAAFGLKLLGIHEPMIGKFVAITIVMFICTFGAVRGLDGIQRAEKITVSANLAAIAALIASLAIFGIHLPEGYSWTAAAKIPHVIDWDTFRLLMGLLIIVQGFETTRFMGQMYAADTRVLAMKTAQKVSSLVYIVFFILLIPLFPYFTSSGDVAGFIGVIDRVTPWLPYVVTIGAIASQFSAAVADSIGASGLVRETTQKRVSAKHAYILIGIVAVLVIWATDVTSVVALASRAFALFYALQCVVAVLIAKDRQEKGKMLWFFILAVVCFAITILGIPASA